MIAIRVLRDLQTANGRRFRARQKYTLHDGDANALIRRGVAVIDKPRKRRKASGKANADNSGYRAAPDN